MREVFERLERLGIDYYLDRWATPLGLADRLGEVRRAA
jgi:hypothetical protein